MPQPQRSEDGKLDQLQSELYSRTAHTTPSHDPSFHKHAYNVAESWSEGTPPQSDTPPLPMNKQHAGQHLFLKRLLTISIGFFVIATMLALYVFYGGRNIVSSENVDISVTGPVSVAGGQEAAFQITVNNNNRTVLKNVELLVELPEGSKSASSSDEELRRISEPIGTISSGGKETKLVRAVLFGEEGSRKLIKMSVEYQVEGSNATFVKDKEYELTVSSAPLVLIVDSPGEATSGQEITFRLQAVSNAPKDLSNVLLTAEYPFGFVLADAEPKPTSGNGVWDLGSMSPQEKKEIVLTGTLSGQDGEERIFRFNAGTGEGDTIGTAFTSLTKGIAISRPFIGVSLATNGKKDKRVIIDPDKASRVDVVWLNNTSGDIRDVEVRVQLEGSFDERSVVVEKGYYRSSDNTVVWDKSLRPDLGVAAPGKGGTLSFSVNPRTISGQSVIKNPEITAEATISAKRIAENNAATDLISKGSQAMSITSKLALSGRVVHVSGPFANTGSLPPQAEKETTYTVIWSLANASSDLKEVSVAATLPSYIRWVGAVSPGEETVTYNPSGGKVVWNVGTLSAGTGYERPVREVAFQVGFTPSLNQIGTIPTLVGDMSAIGKDSWSTATLSAARGLLNTNLTTDSNYRVDNDKVVK